MREIKFRAWDKGNKVMVHPKGILFDGRVVNFSCGMLEPFEEYELMQFTGLYDKNGKEIYEGDIVNVNHYDGTPKYETVRFYTIAGFAGIHPFTDSGYHWASHRCEIVGNIFQDGDLLRDS